MVMKYTFLKELPQSVVELAQRNHARMVKDTGKYKPLEAMALVQDLPNKKIADLENLLDWSVYHYLHGLQNGTINVPHYIHYDLLDEDGDFYIMTFEEIRDWLYDFWESNPNEDDEEEEQKENLEEIEAIMCPSSLNDRLGGVGYAMDEIELGMESALVND
ncbi:hypothetical protein NSQ62_08110 [Solibacillus sp. FSL H8-0523]|uniref:hypothetical protein n=1 Tax=Solibacillus sp. FSL H8-0523 TaxID=2954511 RepID=UPI00310129BE